MGKQYISTVSAAQAHELDIFGLAITNKYTITVSSDGYAKFWDNKVVEVHDPQDYVHSIMINKIGIHHIASFESILPNTTIKIVVLALVCFDGSIIFKYYINDDITTMKDIDNSKFQKKFWAPKFYKDPESKQDYFICTMANSAVSINQINFIVNDSNIEVTINNIRDLKFGLSCFPHSLAVCQTEDKFLAVGYDNGDVVLCEFIQGKIIYTFHSSDLRLSKNLNSKSIPRIIEFSPGGSILAVARDIQSVGSITLYDVKYGENIGCLTAPSHSSKVSVGGFAHDGWIMGLSFDDEGKNLISCGFDKCARIWNLQTKEREATINISITDLENTDHEPDSDSSIASGVSWVRKGIRGGAGNDSNEGICIISFDRGIRWYREAGGI